MTTLITPLAIGIAFAVASIHRDRARKARREVERLAAELKESAAKRSEACHNAFRNGYALGVDVRRAREEHSPDLAYSLHSDRQDVFGGRVTTEMQ